MTILLTFDEGPGVGLGHRRRCEVIAFALRDRGRETVVLPCRDAGVADAPIVVVDSYRHRADDRARVRAGLVVALDDLRRDLDVAIVVDPAPGASTAPHRRAGTVLAGAEYALVDRHLRDLGARSTDVHPRTVLVATGAADAEGVGAALAAELVASDLVDQVRLVVGPWGARTVPAGVEALERRDGLAIDLAAADIVVTAGGVTLLESLCLGRPTVAVTLAANQRGNVEGVTSEGAALGVDPAGVLDSVRRLVESPALRRELAAAAATLIDGRGADRVADAIEASLLRAAA